MKECFDSPGGQRRSALFIGKKEDDDFLYLRKALKDEFEVFFMEDMARPVCSFDLFILDADGGNWKKKLKEMTNEDSLRKTPLLLYSKDAYLEVRYHYLRCDGVLLKGRDSKELILAKISRAVMAKKETYYVTQRKDKGKERKEFELRLLEDFEEALRKEEFEVFYQPKFNITGKENVLSSAEALVRWFHPRLGMLPPSLFIPLLEEYGRIFELDSYVWRKAAMQIRDWKRKGFLGIPVSVNVSRLDLTKEELVFVLEDIISQAGISPNELLLEVTESAYMEEDEGIVKRIWELNRQGFLIEMDDFGTGYSSLSMAKSLPIDAIKIDMRFVKEAFKGKADTGMIEIIVKMAKYLKVLSVAEGIENVAQLDALKRIGLDIGQGYYFSKPVPAQDFEPFLNQRMSLLENKRD